MYLKISLSWSYSSNLCQWKKFLSAGRKIWSSSKQNVIYRYDISKGSSRSWTYGSWIYNYMCHQCLSPLMLRVRIPSMVSCTRYNIMW